MELFRYLGSVFPEREWSGVIFYTFELDDNLEGELELIDFLLMDIGSKGFTEYHFDSSVSDIMMEKEYVQGYEGKPVKLGHLHSHNSMKVFFSGVDEDELCDNSPNHDYYLSVIVNNAMDIIARTVYKPVVVNPTIEIFGKSIQVKEPINISTKTFLYNDVIINKEKIEYPFDINYINNRIKEVDKPKKQTFSLFNTGTSNSLPAVKDNSIFKSRIVELSKTLSKRNLGIPTKAIPYFCKSIITGIKVNNDMVLSELLNKFSYLGVSECVSILEVNFNIFSNVYFPNKDSVSIITSAFIQIRNTIEQSKLEKKEELVVMYTEIFDDLLENIEKKIELEW